MVNCGKEGNFIPMVLLASKHTTLTNNLFEPSCYLRTKNDTNLRKVMGGEYYTLLENGIGLVISWNFHITLVEWVF